MTELAANEAMDSQTSQQTCATDIHSLIAGLEQYIHNDVHKWQVCSEAHNLDLRISKPNVCVTSGWTVVI